MIEKWKAMTVRRRRLVVLLASFLLGCLNLPAMFMTEPGWMAVGVTAAVYLIWIMWLMVGLRDARSKMAFCTTVNVVVLGLLAVMTAAWFLAQDSWMGEIVLKTITVVLGTPVVGILQFWPGGLFDMICFAYVMLAVIVWLVKGLLYSERKQNRERHL